MIIFIHSACILNSKHYLSNCQPCIEVLQVHSSFVFSFLMHHINRERQVNAQLHGNIAMTINGTPQNTLRRVLQKMTA